MDASRLKSCRVCGSQDLHLYLDLGDTPLANNLVVEQNQPEPYFPLQVVFCNKCALSSLNIVVDPKIMFDHYRYRSSVSRHFARHCADLAEDALGRLARKKDVFAVDIASNDGCLLEAFKAVGASVQGVDPASNLAAIANANGIPTLAQYWSQAVARGILADRGAADVITATNVFAHVDDVHGFVEGVRTLLRDDGYFLVEAPYAVDLIEKVEFDTIYHEHLSYFLLKPLVELFNQHDMAVADVKWVPIHGGSIRVFAQKRNAAQVSANVAHMLEQEKQKGFHKLATYENFATRVAHIKTSLNAAVNELRSQGKRIAAYGASAKGSTLLNYCDIGADRLDFVVDDTPEKQNCKTPGMHLPIRDRSALTTEKCDCLVILAWNFKEEIMSKTADFKARGGRYIIPIPEVQLI